EVTELDYQQNTIEQILLPHRARIAGARCAMAAATDVMYDAIEARIDVLVSRSTYPCRYLVLMGGILINSDYDVGSFCSCRRLLCIDMRDGHRQDWMHQLSLVCRLRRSMRFAYRAFLRARAVGDMRR